MSLPHPGQTLSGKYRLEQVLGEGGYGRVYLATTFGTERQVAVKVLKVGDSLNDTVRVTRFLREMRAIAKLTSPHTVTLFDYGKTEDGAPFMVCEYVEGEDLQELLARDGGLDERSVTHVLTQLLRSLAEAHEHGILHRDLKPANVRIFAYSGDPLRAKLLDFGLAHSAGQDEARLTGTGKVVGTPRYMSPEQIFGHELTPASDIYSLGLLTYEMVVGSHRAREIPPGRPRGLTVEHGVSEEFAAVVNRMLAIEVRDRLTRASEVLDALHALSDRRPAASMAPKLDERAPPPVRAAPKPPDAGPATAPPEATPPVDGRLRAAGILAVGGIVVALGALAVVSGGREDAGETAAPVAESTRRLPPTLVRPAEQVVVAPTPAPDLGGEHVPTDGVAGSAGCEKTPPLTGFGKLRFIEGLTARELQAYVPTDYDRSTTYPLIVLLHESGADPGDFIAETRFHDLADDVVVVAPYGGFEAAWGHQSHRIISAAIDDALASLCIDPTRIFVVGHSSGGGAAEQVPCRIPRVRAIATTAYIRTLRSSSPCPDDPIPAIALIGKDDGYNPVAGGKSCSGHTKYSLPDVEAMWRKRNTCKAESAAWFEFRGSRCMAWDCQAPYVTCVLNGGRGWDGTGDRPIDLHDCDGEPADFPHAETIWRFFSSVAAMSDDDVADE